MYPYDIKAPKRTLFLKMTAAKYIRYALAFFHRSKIEPRITQKNTKWIKCIFLQLDKKQTIGYRFSDIALSLFINTYQF